MNVYETDDALSEYLLFHYGEDTDVLPWPDGPVTALRYPVRTVERALRPAPSADGRETRALDLGCAVGRSTFELTRLCDSVVGIDSSRRFIDAANHIKLHGFLRFAYREEGDIVSEAVATRPPGVDPRRVTFEIGDAMDLRRDLGEFDVIHASNLLDRLRDPGRLLARLPQLVRPGSCLVLASPFTWREEFTPRGDWIGGRIEEGRAVHSAHRLAEILDPHFRCHATADLQFLIREHARKYQWSVAHVSTWVRRQN
jgi:putative 4-mercaptohistidine N1-methyltranferase